MQVTTVASLLMRFRWRFLAVAMVVGLSPAFAAAQGATALPAASGEAAAPIAPAVISRDAAGHVTVRAVRLQAPLRIDGRLDEAVYEQTEAIGGFLQQEPNEGLPASERTDAWVFFDDDNVYVSARCFDTHPERMVANEMRRDTSQLRQNDTFAVLFDTYHDRRNGFLFYANPIGGFADSQITDEGAPNTDWNTIWEVRTGRFDGGWTIEMAIPFKSLRYQPGVDQVWGINLRRVVRWKNEWSHLTQIPRALTTFRGILKVSSAATLVGLQVPAAGPNIELKPYAISTVSTDNTARPAVSNDLAARIGGDAKYGITPNLTTDFTVLTDFAQVEVDEQQVNLTRFNLFFPEKRDFFLENSGIFDFGTPQETEIFFSRRIGIDFSGIEIPIDAGVRLSGTAGRYELGFLNIKTREVGGLAPANDFSVIRVKRQLRNRSSIGVI